MARAELQFDVFDEVALVDQRQIQEELLQRQHATVD
jgi:hypothetical protein